MPVKIVDVCMCVIYRIQGSNEFGCFLNLFMKDELCKDNKLIRLTDDQPVVYILVNWNCNEHP